MYLGGGFGRRFAPDFTVDATLLSKASGKPVKLVYTREDDMKAYFYRPASVTRFVGGLDAGGKAVSFFASIASPSIMEASGFMKLPADGVDEMAVEGIGDCPYDFPNLRIEYARREPGVQVWFWRSVGHSQNLFFIESFVDEMAAAAGKDPYEFRRGLLGKQPRYRGALDLAAQRAGWGEPLPPGVHRGIAVAQSFGSYVAEVAEVSVGKDGKVKVHRVVGAVDCGMTVNPEIIKRQVESAIVYGLSAALYGKITFKDGRVEQSNFSRLSGTAHRRDAQGGGAYRREQRAAGRHGRAGPAAAGAGGRQRDIRRDRQAAAQAAYRQRGTETSLGSVSR